MTIEEQLKQRIIDEYGSVRAFTIQKELTYASVDSILRRGIKNTTWTNIKKFCAAFGITTDGLAQNKIIKVEKKTPTTVKVEDLLDDVKQQIMNGDNLTLDNLPITDFEIMQLVNGIDTAVEVIIKNRRFTAYYNELKKDDIK